MTEFPLPEQLAARVVVYQTAYCGYCIWARRLLDKRGIDHLVVDVAGNHDARDWLRQASGQRTVPQIFIDRRSIGGYDELSALDRSGELARLMAASGSPAPDA